MSPPPPPGPPRRRTRSRPIDIPGAVYMGEEPERGHESLTDTIHQEQQEQEARTFQRLYRQEMAQRSSLDKGLIATAAQAGSVGSDPFTFDEEVAAQMSPSPRRSPAVFRLPRSPPPDRPNRPSGSEVGLAGIDKGRGHYYQLILPERDYTQNDVQYIIPPITLEIFVPWTDVYQPQYYFKETRRWKAKYLYPRKEKFGGVGPFTRHFRFRPPIQPGQRYEDLSPGVTGVGVHPKMDGLSRRIQNFDRVVHMQDVDEDWFKELPETPIPSVRMHRAPPRASPERHVWGRLPPDSPPVARSRRPSSPLTAIPQTALDRVRSMSEAAPQMSRQVDSSGHTPPPARPRLFLPFNIGHGGSYNEERDTVTRQHRSSADGGTSLPVDPVQEELDRELLSTDPERTAWLNKQQ